MNNNTNTPSNSSSSSLSSDCFKVRGWYPQGQFYLTNVPFYILQSQFLIVFILTQSLHHLIFKHIGLPPLASQLTAGILLSPNLLIRRVEVLKTTHEVIFPKIGDELWETMGVLGLSLFLFLIAVKMDFTIIRRNGKKPFVIGFLILVVPYGVTKLVAFAFTSHANVNGVQGIELLSSVTPVVLTTFPVIAILLSDLNLLHSELGRLALSSGIVSELGSIYLMLASKTMADLKNRHATSTEVLYRVIGTIILVTFVICIMRPLMRLIIKRTPKGRPIKSVYLVLVIMFMLLGGKIMEVSGEHVMLGCFIVGAAMPDGPPLGSAIVHKFESFIFGMLMPFFITTSVMTADFSKIDFGDKLFHGQLLLTFSSFATKIIICIACGWFYNLAMFDTLALAAIMCSKGIIDISSYVMFRDDKVIQDSSFAYLTVVTTITAIVVPIAIKLLYHPLRKYGGYQRRDIMHSKANAPLQIIACIHRPDNVSSLTKLLTLSGITSENRVVVNVLHLIKLVGRAQSMFISHNLQQRNVSKVAYSEDVIWALNTFHKANIDALSMHLFTAITPTKAMHEDICTLALDKRASVIILPFHRKLTIDGSIDFEDHAQRVLNYSILERAPCSVGILVDRGSPRQSTKLAKLASQADEDYKTMIGVIYIGGKDDQEAVAYAKRMAQGGNAQVVVIRIVSLIENSRLNLLDASVLSEIQEYSSSNPHFHFKQKAVKEGSETATILKDIIEDFELIIVGRRYLMDCVQTSGLKDWSEVPELGILGDLLASPDLRCRASILIIQQQKQWTWKDK